LALVKSLLNKIFDASFACVTHGQKYWAGWRGDKYFGSYPRDAEFKSSESH
jgi:hypothetical protein